MNKNQEKQVIGSMCSSLCDPKNKYEIYREYELVDCHNQSPLKDESNNKIFEVYDGFKAVLVYELKEKFNQKSNKPKRLVLKSRHKYYLDFDTHMDDDDFKDKPIVDQLNYLSAYIETTLESKYGVKFEKKEFNTWIEEYKQNSLEAIKNLNNSILKNQLNTYVRLFSMENFDFYYKALKEQNKNALATFIQNLIILMSQDEYLFYSFFQLKPGSLKLYGSCGHFYLVEYAEPLTYKVRVMNVDERKKLALKFLDLIYNFDSTYLLNKKQKTSIPIQICDVKLENFGLNQNDDLKLIDTDMAHPNVYLFSNKLCKKHEDCHFFDCKSFCDPSTNRCVKSRINNNLQAICEKIFDNIYNKADGILTASDLSSNVKSEIKRRLDECKSPGFYHDSDVPLGANSTLIRVFNILLNDYGIKLNSE